MEFFAVIVVSVSAIFGPILLAFVTGKQRRAEKLEDYARQDAVAAQAARAAQLMEETRDAIVIQLPEIKHGNTVAEEVRDAVTTQLPEIHTAVNSTATKQQEKVDELQEENKKLRVELQKQLDEKLTTNNKILLDRLAILEARLLNGSNRPTQEQEPTS